MVASASDDWLKGKGHTRCLRHRHLTASRGANPRCITDGERPSVFVLERLDVGSVECFDVGLEGTERESLYAIAIAIAMVAMEMQQWKRKPKPKARMQMLRFR